MNTNKTMRDIFKKHASIPLVIALLLLLVPHAARGEEAFTIAVIPDTQKYTVNDTLNKTFENQTQWIADNLKSQWLKDNLGSNEVSFVTHLGDVVENGGVGANQNADQWQRSLRAMATLDGDLQAKPDGLVPYSVTMGNHDLDAVHGIDGTATQFTKHYGKERYAGRSWYGGSSENERNHFQSFQAGGYNFLNLNLQWQATDDDIAWAQGVIDNNPDAAVILTTHAYLYNGEPFPDANKLNRTGNNGEQIFEKLVKPNEEIFMVLNGHFPEPESKRVTELDDGRTLYELESNYQDRANGGDGWLRLMTFDFEDEVIRVQTYSTTLERFEEDANSQFEMPMNLEFFEQYESHAPEPGSLSMLGGALLILARRDRSKS